MQKYKQYVNTKNIFVFFLQIVYKLIIIKNITMDKTQIIKKLQVYKQFYNNVDFADFLGISNATLCNWIARNTYNLEILILKFPEISPRWLVTGEGEMLLSNEINKLNIENKQSVNVNGDCNMAAVGNEITQIAAQNSEFIEIAKQSLTNQAETLDILKTAILTLINNK